MQLAMFVVFCLLAVVDIIVISRLASALEPHGDSDLVEQMSLLASSTDDGSRRYGRAVGYILKRKYRLVNDKVLVSRGDAAFVAVIVTVMFGCVWLAVAILYF